MGTAYDIVILGAGAAGRTAGIYAERARRSVLVLDEGTVGGQMVLSHNVANYPGVAETSGRELGHRFFANRPIAIVGGGNSGLEEEVSLTRYASGSLSSMSLTSSKAEPWVVAEARANEKISFLMNQRLPGFAGDAGLAAVRSDDKEGGTATEALVVGSFVLVGHAPGSEAFEGQVILTEGGDIVTDGALPTKLPGVVAAGDVRHKRGRQTTTAVADGTMAALSALEQLIEGAP